MTFTIEQASNIIGIQLPTTANALKSAFRRRSRQVHPDHSIAVDAKEQFQSLTAAYEFAQLQRGWLLTDDNNGGPAKCVDGTLLSDLGKGLGPTVNGRPCKPCDGKGFQSYNANTYDFTDCVDCRVRFRIVEYRCRRCGGDGMFKRDGKGVGKCGGCVGTGWIMSKTTKMENSISFGPRRIPSNHCVICKGTNKIGVKTKKLYHKCSKCKGTGEILVFNPVIPKGLLR